MDRQQEFVLRSIEERDIRFVRLWFTDVLGYLKSVAIAPAELEGAFEEGIGFDGSSIEGFARVSESDTVARPDPSTFQVLPWTTSAGKQHSARMFCDITMPDGSPSWADSRHVLRRQLARASDLGFSCYVVDRDGRVLLPHTVVPPRHGGRGHGTALVRGTLDDLRARGVTTVVPTCWFVGAFIDRHPEYADLVGGS